MSNESQNQIKMTSSEGVVGRKQSKLDEYRKISDLSGFDNLKAMIQAEALMRSNKRKRTNTNTECRLVHEIQENKTRSSKLDEYRKISDLTGFDNLKAMLEAEAFIKRKKTNRKKKRKTELPTQHNVTIDATKGNEDACMSEAVETTKAVRPHNGVNPFQVIDVILFSPQEAGTVKAVEATKSISIGAHDGIVHANEIEDAGAVKSLQTTKTIGADCGVNSVEVIDLCLSPPECRFVNQFQENKRRSSKLDEYRKISDLTGFDNLKAMLEAEAFIKRKKTNKKRTTTIEVSTQHNVTINATKEKEDACMSETVETAKAVRADSGVNPFEVIHHVLLSPEDAGTVKAMEATKSVGADDGIVLANEKEDAGASAVKSVEITETMGADSGVNSVEVVDLCLSSPEDAGTSKAVETTKAIGGDHFGLSDVRLRKGVEMPTKRLKTRSGRNLMKMTPAKDMVADAKDENGAEHNVVLRRLLRKPRYFDPPMSNISVTCKAQQRIKPCFYCGSFEHIWKHCTQCKTSFRYKGGDSVANDCPETGGGNDLSSSICLRCGDSGHDMFSCRGDYPAEDLKEIQCYKCKSFGHLCCVDFPVMDVAQVSCYNCGESNHLGSECKKPFKGLVSINSNFVCFKCGEEGHSSRRCAHIRRQRQKNSGVSSSAETEGVVIETRNHNKAKNDATVNVGDL